MGKREFNCKEDIWEVMDMLIEETREVNVNSGKEFDVALSIKSQVPFFACPNMLYDLELQKDIKRYLYCKESSVSPYPGSFGDQPYIWTEKHFIIKQGFAKLEKNMIDKQKSMQKGK